MTRTISFQLFDQIYETDAETASVLADAMTAALSSKDTSAVQAIMLLGQMAGRIRMIDATKPNKETHDGYRND